MWRQSHAMVFAPHGDITPSLCHATIVSCHGCLTPCHSRLVSCSSYDQCSDVVVLAYSHPMSVSSPPSRLSAAASIPPASQASQAVAALHILSSSLTRTMAHMTVDHIRQRLLHLISYHPLVEQPLNQAPAPNPCPVSFDHTLFPLLSSTILQPVTLSLLSLPTLALEAWTLPPPPPPVPQTGPSSLPAAASTAAAANLPGRPLAAGTGAAGVGVAGTAAGSGSGGPVRDTFRMRRPNTSRSASVHVDDFTSHSHSQAAAAAVAAAAAAAASAPPQGRDVGTKGGVGDGGSAWGTSGRAPSIHVDEFMARQRQMGGPQVVGAEDLQAKSSAAGGGAAADGSGGGGGNGGAPAGERQQGSASGKQGRQRVSAAAMMTWSDGEDEWEDSDDDSKAGNRGKA